MRFLLDENVPHPVIQVLKDRGHTVDTVLDHTVPGTPDPVVAALVEELEAVLVTFDGDFEKARKFSRSERRRMQRIDCILMSCFEGIAASRLSETLSLIEFEYKQAQAQGGRQVRVWLMKEYIRFQR